MSGRVGAWTEQGCGQHDGRQEMMASGEFASPKLVFEP